MTTATAASIHSLWTTLADLTPGAAVTGAAFQAPKVEYAQLSPVLMVFGVAILGVLVEAFLPRRSRYTAQLSLCVVGLAAAFAAGFAAGFFAAVAMLCSPSLR